MKTYFDMKDLSRDMKAGIIKKGETVVLDERRGISSLAMNLGDHVLLPMLEMEKKKGDIHGSGCVGGARKDRSGRGGVAGVKDSKKNEPKKGRRKKNGK